jgi:thioredoxin 2
MARMSGFALGIFAMSTIEMDEGGLLVPCPNCGQRNRLLGQTFRCGKCHAELGAPPEPIDVQADAEFFDLTNRASLPVIVDFWAPWCGPCKMVAPELAKVAAEGAGRWVISKVDTEQLPTLAQRFQITGIPTLILFDHGSEIARQSGAMPATRIRQFVEQVRK